MNDDLDAVTDTYDDSPGFVRVTLPGLDPEAVQENQRDPDGCCAVCCRDVPNPRTLRPLREPWHERRACGYCRRHAPRQPDTLSWWLSRSWLFRLAVLKANYLRDPRIWNPRKRRGVLGLSARSTADVTYLDEGGLPDHATLGELTRWPNPPNFWDKAGPHPNSARDAAQDDEPDVD